MTLENIEKRLVALERLEKRVETLEDIEEIKTLTRHYVNSLVFVKWDDVVDCFADNASVEIGVAGLRQGKAAIAKLFKEEICTRHIGKEMVFVVHPEISLDGNRAKGSWLLYFMFTKATHIQPMAWVQGPYDLEYEKVKGNWKISRLKWIQRLGPKPIKLMKIYGAKDI
ncbi:MAG: hypothetical protein A2144_12755 [Chloroflexi bacterium RBG_16_50_9]|nr:MAG: hypothetical protein A2144_12755 [Chloroflexi bacterium RBG_16_50_9]